MVGADLVMPGRFLQGEPLAKLIESERVTLTGAVPTIWMDVLRYSDEHKPDLSKKQKFYQVPSRWTRAYGSSRRGALSRPGGR